MSTQPSKGSESASQYQGTEYHTRAYVPSSVYSVESGYSHVFGPEIGLVPVGQRITNMPQHYAVLPIQKFLAVPGNPDIHPALRQDCITKIQPTLQVSKVETENVEGRKVKSSAKTESSHSSAADLQGHDLISTKKGHDAQLPKRDEKEKKSKSKARKGNDKNEPHKRNKDGRGKPSSRRERKGRDTEPTKQRPIDANSASRSFARHKPTPKPFPIHILLRRITTAQIPTTSKTTLLISLHNTLIELLRCTTSELELARRIDATFQAAEASEKIDTATPMTVESLEGGSIVIGYQSSHAYSAINTSIGGYTSDKHSQDVKNIWNSQQNQHSNPETNTGAGVSQLGWTS